MKYYEKSHGAKASEDGQEHEQRLFIRVTIDLARFNEKRHAKFVRQESVKKNLHVSYEKKLALFIRRN